MAAVNEKIRSAEEEQKLLAPIDEHIGAIQKKIDELRVDGTDRVTSLTSHIAVVRENANYTKEEKAAIIAADRKELEKGQEKKDYKAELTKLFANFDTVFDTPHKRFVAAQYRKFFLKVSNIATEEDFRAMYESLVAGDPKLRNQRALYMKIFGKYVKNAKEKEAELYG